MPCAKLVVVVVLGGCSLFATSRHPDRTAPAHTDPCASMIVPALDGVTAALMIAASVFVIRTEPGGAESGTDLVLLGVGAALAVGFGTSTAIGVARIGACDDEAHS